MDTTMDNNRPSRNTLLYIHTVGLGMWDWFSIWTMDNGLHKWMPPMIDFLGTLYCIFIQLVWGCETGIWSHNHKKGREHLRWSNPNGPAVPMLLWLNRYHRRMPPMIEHLGTLYCIIIMLVWGCETSVWSHILKTQKMEGNALADLNPTLAGKLNTRCRAQQSPCSCGWIDAIIECHATNGRHQW